MFFYIIGICIVLFLLLVGSVFPRLYQVYRIQKTLQKYYPVQPHWLWGHLKIIGQTEYLKKGVEWGKSYPKCFALNFGPLRPVLTLNHPDTVKLLLRTTEPKCLVGDGGYKLFLPWIGDGLLLSRGDKWSRNRHLLTPGFHIDVLKPYIDVYNESSRKLIAIFENGSRDGKSIEVCRPVSLHTLDVILRCAFTYQEDIQVPEFNQGKTNSYISSVMSLSKLIAERAFQPLWYLDSIYYRTKCGQDFKRHCNISHAKAMEVIQKRRNALDKGEDPTSQKRYVDFLDILLLAKDQDGKGLTDAEIQDEVETFMFAGHDTTASGLSWALYNLARHPEIQEKMYKEVHTQLGTEKEMSWEHMSRLEYTTMCIKESLRLHPPVHFTSRELTKSLTIDGNLFLPGTIVDSPVYLVHHNPTVWGENHMAYDPDRFLPDNIAKMDPYAFIPFSAGPRNCIGQVFAMNEMKTTISLIINHFKLSVDSNHMVDVVPEIILKAKNGIKLHFEKRY